MSSPAFACLIAELWIELSFLICLESELWSGAADCVSGGPIRRAYAFICGLVDEDAGAWGPKFPESEIPLEI